MLTLSPASPSTPQYTPYAAHPSPAVAPALGRAFDAASHHQGFNADAPLRDATFALVARLRANGLSPERALVAVKAALTRYGGLHYPPSLDGGDGDRESEERSLVYRHVFEWFLEAYFG